MNTEVRKGQVTIRQSEQEIQDAIVDALRAVGCTVYTTNTHGVRRATGVTKGVPDLLVGHGSLPFGCLFGLEVKKPVGWKWSSYEQWDAWSEGHTMLTYGAGHAVRLIHARFVELGMDLSIRNRIALVMDELKGTEVDHESPTTKKVPVPTGRGRR